MWTFTRDGFYSVTKNTRDDDDTLMVRARVEADLERFVKRIGTRFDPEMLEAKIIETPKSDYRFRVIVPRWVWGEYLTMMVDDLDYSNVKDTLAPMKTEKERHSAMMGCWTAMARLQPGGAYGGRLGLHSEWDGPLAQLPVGGSGYGSLWDRYGDDMEPDDDEDDEIYCDTCDWFHSPNEACEMIG